jgi:hypothetical protein
MLLTLPVILGILAVASDSSAANIYARIRAFYQYNKNLPDALGRFFFADTGLLVAQLDDEQEKDLQANSTPKRFLSV